MMRRMLALIALAGAALPGIVAAQVWIAPARDDGMAVPCRTAADGAAFTRALDQAGWSRYGQERPAIDFARSVAVVVAPGRFRANADLKLVERGIVNGRRVVRWRFAPRAPVIAQREETVSYGSAGPAGKEILVVAFPRAAIRLPQACLGAY